ncbi:KpsF/GutQ family sugar-phosphate isomerase [Sneathiella chungangensis]|uniref:KpsF/GutQ family sugar-phosphate isomerase n=1 Tax=Sneathiella chungangensis TaxID=1418234 RepID=A0A845MJ07_9PROT|nr:KpsF/GutQ family sugar-phosphate isomerase [Sneathiella chungangensis]MZR23809.1 KpsF/GutQ family sugar-phosphate isomerase [Sneathiella chungangensis]
MTISKEAVAARLDETPDLVAARKVLKTEADALMRLLEDLDGEFVKALDFIFKAKGRVVVSGMGKSGHIGNKIAATLASTGTPAQFVHPAEASHGDLGMITKNDVVLCLSNSGGTKELSDIIAYTRRFNIPLIAIVGKADSTLGRRADAVLLLPDVPEACPMGLAPTTSTTAALALGDALAVALLCRRGFDAEQFRVFHPGGKLGGSLIKVEDLMHSGDAMPLVEESTLMSEALIEISAKSFGCVGIMNADQELVGIITDGDLRRHMGADLLKKSVSDVMTRNPQTISPTALAGEALAKMNSTGFNGITCLFVVDRGRTVGIISVHDCLRSGVM